MNNWICIHNTLHMSDLLQVDYVLKTFMKDQHYHIINTSYETSA